MTPVPQFWQPLRPSYFAQGTWKTFLWLDGEVAWRHRAIHSDVVGSAAWVGLCEAGHHRHSRKCGFVREEVTGSASTVLDFHPVLLSFLLSGWYCWTWCLWESILDFSVQSTELLLLVELSPLFSQIRHWLIETTYVHFVLFAFILSLESYPAVGMNGVSVRMHLLTCMDLKITFLSLKKKRGIEWGR